MRKLMKVLALILIPFALLWAVPTASGCGYGTAVASFGYGYSLNLFPALSYVAVYPVQPVVPVAPAAVPAPQYMPPAVSQQTVAPAPDPGLAAGTYGVAPTTLATGYTPAVATFAGVGVLPVYYRAGFGYSVFNTRFNRFVGVGYNTFTGVRAVGGFHGAAFASAGFAGQQVVVGGRGRAVVAAQAGVGGFGQQAVVSGGRRGASVVAQQGGFAGQQVVVNSQRRGLLGRRSSTSVVVQQGGGAGGVGQQAVIRSGRRR